MMNLIESRNPGNGNKSAKALFWAVALLACLAVETQAAGPWKFIVYGDTRTDDAAHRGVLTAITTTSQDYTFMINVGDVVEDGRIQAQWDTWQTACNDILGGTGQASVPPRYMAVPGNHDQILDPSGLAHWNLYLPGQNTQFGNNGTFFTFDYQNVRFILLNPYQSLTGPQATLLQQAIQSNTQAWLFAIWHPPIFDFGVKVYEGTLHTTWGVPLHQAGCDIIFTGHAHYYVRSLRLNLNGDMNPPLDPVAGTVQIVTGNSGAPLVPVDENHDGNGYMVAYSYDQAQSAFYGYTEISVNGNQATVRHIRAADSMVMDTVTYTANPKPATPTPTVSATVTATVTPAVPALTIQAFPNPARDRVFFAWQAPGVTSIHIRIFNVLGEQISEIRQEHPGQGITWSLANVAPGIYFYHIITRANGVEKVHRPGKIAVFK